MDQLQQWQNFNIAMTGATAALAGLVIVAASVNITKIIQATTVTARMAAAIAALVLALVVSALGLVPDISANWYGGVIVVGAVIAGLFQFHATLVITNDAAERPASRFAKTLVGFLPVAAYLTAGIVILGNGDFGLLMTAVGCLLAIVSALLISWIALVEVLR